jgi:AcrR family transcriptional regulator
MMQYVKDEIRRRLIAAAREEFLEKGFAKASIRMITTEAKVSKSNLYNYFSDKDDLFYRVLEPTLVKIQNGLEMARTLGAANGLDLYTKEAQERNIRVIIEFVYANLNDLKLLLFQAKDSSLENFKDHIINSFTEILSHWVKANIPDQKISDFFIRSVVNFYLSTIEQLIINEAAQECAKYLEEFVNFIYYGWKGAFNGKANPD